MNENKNDFEYLGVNDSNINNEDMLYKSGHTDLNNPSPTENTYHLYQSNINYANSGVEIDSSANQIPDNFNIGQDYTVQNSNVLYESNTVNDVNSSFNQETYGVQNNDNMIDQNYNMNDVYTPSNMIDNNYTNNSSDDDRYLSEFVGKNYDKISKKGFSIPAFFFSGLYLIYRKMYLMGILIYLIDVLISSIVSIVMIKVPDIIIPMIYFIIHVGISIFLGINANKIYINYANKQVSKLKSFQNTDDYIINECRRRGGTNIWFVILIVVIVSIVSNVITTSIRSTILLNDLMGNINDNFNNNDDDIIDDENDNQNDDVDDDVVTNEYNGLIVNNTNINVYDEFSVMLPIDYREDFMNSDYSIEYVYESGNSECTLKLETIDGFDNVEALANSMADYYSYNGNVNFKEVNNIPWYHFTTEDFTDISYYGITVKDEIMYLHRFKVNTSDESIRQKCLLDNKIFIDSLKLK